VEDTGLKKTEKGTSAGSWMLATVGKKQTEGRGVVVRVRETDSNTTPIGHEVGNKPDPGGQS